MRASDDEIENTSRELSSGVAFSHVNEDVKFIRSKVNFTPCYYGISI